MEVEVLQIEDTECFLVRGGVLSRSGVFAINGVGIDSMVQEQGFVVGVKDNFTYTGPSKVLTGYRREDGAEMTIEDYKSKPRYHDEDSSDEQVLRAIANKKELEGFEPCYIDPLPVDVEFNIIGKVMDTGSVFISSSIQGRFSKAPVLYTVAIQKATMDEYNKLRDKYKDQAKFEIPDRSYLRFVQINRNYVFGDCRPFSECSDSSFSDIDKAVEAERSVREAVSKVVMKTVFPESLTGHKSQQLIDQLNIIKKASSRREMTRLLSEVIKGLRLHV